MLLVQSRKRPELQESLTLKQRKKFEERGWAVKEQIEEILSK